MLSGVRMLRRSSLSRCSDKDPVSRLMQNGKAVCAFIVVEVLGQRSRGPADYQTRSHRSLNRWLDLAGFSADEASIRCASSARGCCKHDDLSHVSQDAYEERWRGEEVGGGG